MSTSPTPVLGVSACLLREGKALLIERSRAPFAGLLSLPGGRVEFGEPLADAVRREVREETGIEIPAFAFLRLHEAIGERFHAVIAVHAAALPVQAAPVAGDDAARVLFVPVDDIARLEAQGETTPGLAAIVQEAARRL